MSSATEAEIGAVLKNCQTCVTVRKALTEMGHPQPPTPAEVDNQCDVGIFAGTIKQKQSRCMDKRFFWVKDRTNQAQFYIYWLLDKGNRAGYFTKHHAPSYHREIRNLYLVQKR